MPRRLVLGIAITLTGVIVGLGVFGATGLRHYRRLAAEAEALAAQNKALTEENQRLTEEVRRLKGDRDYIEKVARDELGHVRQGETTYLVPTTDTAKQ